MEKTDAAAEVSPRGQGRGPTNAYEPFRIEDVEQSIPARFAKQVQLSPAAIAVESVTDRLTYDELNNAANRLTKAIISRRGTDSEPVALLVSHGAPQIVAILGILKAGKIYVPLDPAYPAARNAAVLQDARPALLVTDNANQTLANRLESGCPVVNVDEVAAGESDAGPMVEIDPGRPAFIIYTSGSTGKPSGLVHSHRNVMHAAMKYTNNFHIGREDRLVVLYSCAFVGSVADIFPALLNGATLLPFDLKRQGIGELGPWLAEKRVTLYQSVPTLFRRFAATLSGTEKFPALRAIRLGGEPVTPRDAELHRQLFGPECLFAVSLAATEILGIRLYFVDRDVPLSGPRVPVGYALPDTEVLLVDESGQPVGPGQVGEMVIRSPYLALGYWDDATRTAAEFRTDPSRPGSREYCLRDLGHLHPDGCLEYLGRKDWQVKVRGHRVEIAEVEAALLAIPGVKETTVVGQEMATGGQRLVAYVVVENRGNDTVSLLRAALQEQLPDYMIPAVFVPMEKLPTTPSGKIDRQALPAPTVARPALRNAYVRPRDPLQVSLCEIWKDCLNVMPVGVQDDFFDLGGDSILAIDMAMRVEQMFGRTIRQPDLLSSRTVEKLAQVLMQPEASATCVPLTVIQSGESESPLFFLHGDFNGGGLYCVPLARHLGSEQGFVAVHPHGVGSPVIPATIEEMAVDRLRSLRETQPAGPYRLGGHCNGALVALEIAHQLIRDGEQVEFLAVLAPPESIQWEIPASGSAVQTEPIPVVDLTGISHSERPPHLLKAYHQACSRYVMRHYPGAMLVVLPHNDLARYRSLERWKRAAAQVVIHAVPGAHLSMLAPRHCGALAKVLNQYLKAPRAEAAVG